jgi:hypothetical protein
VVSGHVCDALARPGDVCAEVARGGGVCDEEEVCAMSTDSSSRHLSALRWRWREEECAAVARGGGVCDELERLRCVRGVCDELRWRESCVR